MWSAASSRRRGRARAARLFWSRPEMAELMSRIASIRSAELGE